MRSRAISSCRCTRRLAFFQRKGAKLREETPRENNGRNRSGDCRTKTISRPYRFVPISCLLGLCLLLSVGARAVAQSGWYAGRQWKVRRSIRLTFTPQSDQEVCLLDCFSHGEINRDHPGLIVVCRRQPIPFRILQQGPGDLLRIAFQTRTGATRYEIYYGGVNRSPPPKWTSRNGLLLEARRFHKGDLFRLDDVRAQFDHSERLGIDYVPNVFLGRLPFAAPTTPVLTRFTGFLHIRKAGLYRLYTSSRDASWLLIDGKQAVAWPGRHRAIGRGRYFGDVKLSGGVHRFEYHHVATGDGLTAVAAWKPPGAKKIAVIPPEAFGLVRRVRSERLEFRSGGSRPDFTIEPLAEAPLGRDRPPLVQVRFVTHPVRTTLHWDFGDGSIETAANPEHIYLQPGLYTVRCSRSGSRAETVCRVPIAPPWSRLGDKGTEADVAKWLPVLKQFRPERMSAKGLDQLVAVYRELGDSETAARIGMRGIESRRTGSRPLDPQSATVLAESLADLLDATLGRPDEALRICEQVRKLKPRGEPALRLELAAARSALSAGRTTECRQHLKQAVDIENKSTSAQTRQQFVSLRGDLARRRHRVHQARAFYTQAANLSPSHEWDEHRRIAMTGVYAHDIEESLRSGDVAKAGTLLRQWERDIPSCKLDGYYALLRSQYELARGHIRTARQESDDALSVAADSPYADRLLLVLAEAQARLKQVAPSQAALRRLIHDYPGSPLVGTARKRLADGFPQKATPRKKKRTTKKTSPTRSKKHTRRNRS